MGHAVNDNYMVCTDCVMFIVNDDLTGLDYHYTAEEAEQRQAAICEGVNKQMKQFNYICSGDSDKSVEFSKSPCDCCGSDLHGTRHHMVVMSIFS